MTGEVVHAHRHAREYVHGDELHPHGRSGCFGEVELAFVRDRDAPGPTFAWEYDIPQHLLRIVEEAVLSEANEFGFTGQIHARKLVFMDTSDPEVGLPIAARACVREAMIQIDPSGETPPGAQK
ncbi:MAG: hypothetical protein AAFV96_10850 [Pseudomonadota bacterium]